MKMIRSTVDMIAIFRKAEPPEPVRFRYSYMKKDYEINDYSLAVKPPFQNAGYRRSRNGVPLSCRFIRYRSA